MPKMGSVRESRKEAKINSDTLSNTKKYANFESFKYVNKCKKIRGADFEIGARFPKYGIVGPIGGRSDRISFEVVPK